MPSPSIDVAKTIADLGPLPSPTKSAVLVLIVGIPGSGKGQVAASLHAAAPLVLIDEVELLGGIEAAGQSFATRLEAERAVEEVAGALLEQGVSVLLNSSSPTAFERRALFSLAERHDAQIVVVEVGAATPVVTRRLEDAASDAEERALATEQADRSEPINHEHIYVDTTSGLEHIELAVEAIRRAQAGERAPHT
ncbi:MAG: AAA family ATPase [Dehalococcoidia bacterium]